MQGYGYAQNDLGLLYEKGLGVELDLKSFIYFKLSADQNNPQGLYNLAFFYSKGLAVNKNLKKATELYQKSSDLGNIEATFNLSLIYQNDLGTLENLKGNGTSKIGSSKRAFTIY